MPTWREITSTNPSHSENYAARWRRLAEEGADIYGEARLIDAMAARGSTILDAGCGQGRIGGYLARRGHRVTGIDIDPVLIAYAEQDFPGASWVVGDLSGDPIGKGDFDLVVSAGNVMGFLAEEGRVPALVNIRDALTPSGRAVIGFSAGRGWAFGDFLADASLAGLDLESAFESWDLRPFDDNSQFLVAVLGRSSDPS
ncbi:class I SAM-dependent methyltransferase [Corynebacterium pacaense]|uniref:class I SAM-dependent methyltransferase n=1 Tax=Corynebacterium pacaense TaxID=1816684 RepID=UPI0009BAAD28|nr:class I SAM-dependent methyltransferase [Corynebacterium pacaense]